MTDLLLTGASGFVGNALLPALAARHRVTLALRAESSRSSPGGVATEIVGEIGPQTDWANALSGVETVIHLAARAHLGDETSDPGAYFRINAAGTLRLAEAAKRAGARHFLYLSSIKVNGDGGSLTPYRAHDPPCPSGPYALSKWQAEQGLARLAETGDFTVTILRPPLVYGPEVKANLLALLRLCRRGLPLPFGATDNRRSLIALGNLVDAIAQVVAAPARPGCSTYLLRDGEDLSTGDLIRAISRHLGRRPALLPVPPGLIRAGLALAGRRAAADRLLGSLTVDDSPFRDAFGWRPPLSVDQGIAAMCRWYLTRDQ